jgi:hypothetical protein
MPDPMTKASRRVIELVRRLVFSRDCSKVERESIEEELEIAVTEAFQVPPFD